MMTRKDDIHTILDVIEEWEIDNDISIGNALWFDLAEHLADKLEQRTAEERERCAKIAEYAYRSQPFLAKPAAIVLGGHIADAIREGGEADDD